MSLAKTFSDFSAAVAHAAGRPWVFFASVAVVLLWGITGPLFEFSDTWQLVINTGTTIITFLMVFLIQNTQNRDGAAIQAKLDELIRASAAHNRYIGIERLTEEELSELRGRCEERARAELLPHVRQAADKAEAEANKKARRAAERAVAG